MRVADIGRVLVIVIPDITVVSEMKLIRQHSVDLQRLPDRDAQGHVSVEHIDGVDLAEIVHLLRHETTGLVGMLLCLRRQRCEQ